MRADQGSILHVFCFLFLVPAAADCGGRLPEIWREAFGGYLEISGNIRNKYNTRPGYTCMLVRKIRFFRIFSDIFRNYGSTYEKYRIFPDISG
jgi:hypothetical protein